MRIGSGPNPKIRFFPFLLLSIFLILVPGTFSSGVVTLKSLQIFQTHEWLNHEPTLYFHCQGENKTMLPDVKKPNFLYTFKGAESWQVVSLFLQWTKERLHLSFSLNPSPLIVVRMAFTIIYMDKPLTELVDNKCKRCGFYEEDMLSSDDVFDEWELCPDDFRAPDGKYTRLTEKEFNATFMCPQCISLEGSVRSSRSKDGHIDKGMNVGLVILISVLVSIVSLVGAVAAYRCWQKKKREHDQARFLKLFEEGDDVEDELGLGM